MLKARLIHPDILSALAAAGHGSTVLIADGNYPVATGASLAATRVFLNLSPDILRVTDVLQVIVEAIPIEAATLMSPDDASHPEPAAHRALAAVLPDGIDVRRVPRTAFYELARSPDVALVIASGDLRTYANVLLTIGVVTG